MRYLLLLLAMSAFLGEDPEIEKHIHSIKMHLKELKKYEYQLGEKPTEEKRDARKLLNSVSAVDFYKQENTDHKHILLSYYPDYFRNK